jgi:hypothetical protein
MLSYRNVRFSGTCQTETPQPINMKFCLVGNIDKITCRDKNVCHRFTEGGPTDE